MKTSIKLVCAGAVAASAMLFAEPSAPCKVSLWRGETYSFTSEKPLAVEGLPAGVTVKAGVAKEVSYGILGKGRNKKKIVGRSSFADRVVWGDNGKGLKVYSVTADKTVKSGVYKAGDIEIEVLDRVLPPPKEWKYYLDLWQHPWAVSRYFNAKPFSKEHFDAMRPLWEMLADAGNKTLTVTITDLPWNHQCYDGYYSMIGRVKTADGKWKFDYSVFDKYVEFGRSCGLGPHIACYTMCPWEYKVYWQDEKGGKHSVKAVPGTGEFKDFWGDFLVDFADHLKSKGWFEDVYIAIDERSPKDVMNIANFIAEKAPGLKIALAGNRSPSEFEGIKIDNCCFSLRHLSDKLVAEAGARRKDGMITTYYVCCSPERPNTFCASRPVEAYWLGTYPAACGLDGFLRWAWNSWPRDPEKDATFVENGRWWASGDTYLVYPKAEPSLRFLELRNGIVAAEKARILQENGLGAGFDKVSKLFNRKDAMAGKSDFNKIKGAFQSFVNGKR